MNGRCPEVDLGILARTIRRSVEHTKSIQNSLVFLGFQARRHIRGDIETEHDQRDRSHKHISKIHLGISMFFFSREKLRFHEFRVTPPQTCDQFRTSNGAADVL